MGQRWLGLLVSVVCAVGLAALCSAAETYSWQHSYARVDPKGDLSWAPEPFAFEKGDSVRYVDFEAGDDSGPGTSQDKPWKHHPWDPAAKGQVSAATGVDTYVFKCGVVYRGSLVAAESGKPGHPIRLTSDPSWGKGEAVIAGSELVAGWKKGADLKEMPEPEKVWVADLPYAPRRVWMVAKDGTITRVALARTANWKVSDPAEVTSEWWQWDTPEWWVEANRTTTVNGTKMCLGIDTKHLTQDPSYYKDAVVWTEWAVVMGTPYATQVVQYDEQKKGLAFEGVWFAASGQINAGNRYFLEDKPQYLDEAGEFWFAKEGEGGRLFIRLPGDVDPNTVQVEAAKRYNLIEDRASANSPLRLDLIGAEGRAQVDTRGVSHIAISGLTLRFNNAWWEYWQPAWMHMEVDNACIRLLGSSDDVRVANCKFEQVSKAVRVEPINDKTQDGSVVVCDNDMQYTDEGAVSISKGAGGMDDAKVLRNNLYMIGMRPYRQSSGRAVEVKSPRVAEVAGNMLMRCYSSGIFAWGSLPQASTGDVPLARCLIHHNRAEQTLLAANDWGGIETNQGGPFYVYDNISADPNGYRNWTALSKPPYGARDGYAFYHDGGYKNYDFNNILWGLNNEKDSKLCNKAAWMESNPGGHNSLFNNTVYRFAGVSYWYPAAGYHSFLGNVCSDVSNVVFMYGGARPDPAAAPAPEYPHELSAFGNNVFYKVNPDHFGSFEVTGQTYKDLHSFQQALVRDKALDAELGVSAASQPLRDPANRDMRLADGSAAIGRGVRFFVPWGLSSTVGEWNFYHVGNDVTKIADERYSFVPEYPLTAVNVTEDSYVQGELEDWIKGALKLNGRDQYCVLPQATIAKPATIRYRQGGRAITNNFPPEQAKSVGVRDSSLILQIYFKTEPAARKVVLIRKMDDQAGYALTVDGAATFAVKAAGKDVSVTGKAAVNDGKWHHVLAEVDRKAGKMTIYVDGQVDAEGAGPGDASLSNGADFYIGGTPTGGCLAGTVDFAMVSLGSLADAKTTIGELYAWQFNGPFLQDFVAKTPNGGKRDAGAIEFQKGD